MTSNGKRKYLWRTTIVFLVAAAGAVIFFWLSESSLLAIEEIDVEGNRVISTEEVLDRVGPLLRGDSLLNPAFDEADRMLLQLPYTESVDLERDFPHAVHIRIREYRPFVNLKAADGKLFILASEGRTLGQVPGLVADYPVLMTRQPCAAEVGQTADCPDAATGVWFLANIPVSFNQQFAEVNVGDGDINAKTRSGVSVHFGTLDDYVLKFEVLRQLLTRTGAAGATMTLDVSVPERPVTRDNTVTVRTSTTATAPDGGEAQAGEAPNAEATAGEAQAGGAAADLTGEAIQTEALEETAIPADAASQTQASPGTALIP